MLETLALMGHGFVNAMSLSNLLFMAGGTAIGIIIGCLPGLSAAMGVALLLPMTFTMAPETGLIVLRCDLRRLHLRHSDPHAGHPRLCRHRH